MAPLLKIPPVRGKHRAVRAAQTPGPVQSEEEAACPTAPAAGALAWPSLAQRSQGGRKGRVVAQCAALASTPRGTSMPRGTGFDSQHRM